MSDEQSPIGHNNPPSPIELWLAEAPPASVAELAEALPAYEQSVYDELRETIKRISADAQAWIMLGRIEDGDTETAAMAQDHKAQLMAVEKKVAEAKKMAAAVWTAKVNDAKAPFAKLEGAASAGKEKMNGIIGDYLQRKLALDKAEADKKAEEARLKLEAERAEAERIRAEAEKQGDLEALAEAKAKEKEVAKLEKKTATVERQADRAGKATSIASASGAGGRTTTRTVKVVTIEHDLNFYLSIRKDDDVREFLQRKAEALARPASFDPAKDKIPGCTVTTKIV